MDANGLETVHNRFEIAETEVHGDFHGPKMGGEEEVKLFARSDTAMARVRLPRWPSHEGDIDTDRVIMPPLLARRAGVRIVAEQEDELVEEAEDKSDEKHGMNAEPREEGNEQTEDGSGDQGRATAEGESGWYEIYRERRHSEPAPFGHYHENERYSI